MWRTSTQAWPAGAGVVGLAKTVSVGLPLAVRLATMVGFSSAFRVSEALSSVVAVPRPSRPRRRCPVGVRAPGSLFRI